MSAESLKFRFEASGNLIEYMSRSKAGVSQLEGQVKRSTSAMSDYSRATGVMDTKTRKFVRGALQQAGYQVGDYAVQVANGTSAIQAFGQQGSQMLGVFGPAGAILGAVVAIMSAVGVAASKSGKEIKDLGSAFGVLQEPISAVKDAVVGMKDAFGSVSPFIVDNIDTAIIAAGLLAAVIGVKYVRSVVGASVASVSFSGVMYSLGVTMVRVSTAVGATAASTKIFATTMYGLGVAVRGVSALLMRFLPIATILAVSKLIEMFLQLKKGAGGFGEALGLLKDVAADMFKRILMHGERMYLGLKAGVKGFQASFVEALIPMAEKFDDFANLLVSKWNQMFSDEIFEPLQLNLGFNVKDQLSQVSEEISNEIETINGRIKEIDDTLSGPSAAMDKLIKAFKNGATEVSIFGDKSEEAGDKGKSALEEMQNRMQAIADTMKSAMTSAFMSIVDGTKSAKDAFKDMARTIIAKLYEVLVVQRLVGDFNAKTGSGSGIVGFLGGLLSGKRAMGGPITAGNAYMVGENGPEVVVPSRNATVLQNGSGASGGVTVVQNNTFGAGVSRAEIQQMLPKIVETTKAAVFDAQRRSVSGMGY